MKFAISSDMHGNIYALKGIENDKVIKSEIKRLAVKKINFVIFGKKCYN